LEQVLRSRHPASPLCHHPLNHSSCNRVVFVFFILA
jgi:hypothetical protein